MSNDKRPTIEIVISGPQGAGKSAIAVAIREMLARADIASAVMCDEERTSDERFAAVAAHVRRLKREIEALEQDLPVDALAGDPIDHRRDLTIADGVLAVLKNAGLREKDAIATAKAVVEVIKRVERSRQST